MAKLPVRNKSKDNPYVLGYDDTKQTYTIQFVDNKKVINNVDISQDLYKAFDKFELEDVSQIHKFQRHIEHSEIYENNLNERAIDKSSSVEEIVEKNVMNEKLYEAIASLPELQSRRIKKYYFENKTLQEIANEECCSKVSIKNSIDIALTNLKKFLEKYKF